MTRRIRKAILGRKVGMSQFYDDKNIISPVTLIEAGPCTVLQVKTSENDGYQALQIGFGDTKKKAKQPQQGIFKKANTAAKKMIREVAVLPGKEFKIGDNIDVSILEGVPQVDVSGTSRGRGYSGTVRRWGKKIGPKSHGSKHQREQGSTGMHQDPGRVPKGRMFPGQYGAENVKVRNLKVISLDPKQNLLLVKGAVPGPRGGYLYIEESLGSLTE